MDKRTRSNLFGGALLLLIGVYLLLAQLNPQFDLLARFNFAWPFWVIASGAALFVFGLLVSAPGMAIPAAIVSGVGFILWYQSATEDWSSWAYMWALIPGFIGFGQVIAGLLGDNTRENIRSGGWMVVFSLGMFILFGFIFRAGLISTYWPVFLIALGLWVLIQPFLRRRSA